MPRKYQPKHLPDGSLNPKFKIRKRPSGPSGKTLSKFQKGHFVAWDGEGVTLENDVHKYVMLVHSEGGSIVNLNGIPTRDCLDAFVTIGERYPRSVHVVFGGSYDVNMVLTDCTQDEIRKVWAGEWVAVCGGRYLINYRARKSFSIKRTGYYNSGGTLKRIRSQGIVLWDVFGFFQSSFVEALKKYLGKEYEPLSLITKRKAERRDFDVAHITEILEYCQLECRALVELMNQLRDYLEQAGLKISRWDGAGACAAALLKRQGSFAHKAPAESTPSAVLLAAQHAYAGGRTETLKYGHAPTTPIFHYDINSAYPFAMQSCPTLSVGEWKRFPSSVAIPDNGNDFRLCRVEWDFADGSPAFPFFWRAFDSSIYYPRSGSGWYWWPEIASAMLAMQARAIKGKLRIVECWELQQPGMRADERYPFQWIGELFEQRKQWKAAGIGAEKVVKLAINSLYGKTAQHIGGSNGKPPRYHQLEWAGYITSRTRAALYKSLIPALKERAGIMLATDAVYSLIPLSLPTGDALGQWSYEPHDGITVVQSGVYWTYNDGKPKAFCRGFDKGSLSVDSILSRWKERSITYDATLTRFVTMGSALASEDHFYDNWQRWKTAPRTLTLTPDGTKRSDIRNWGKRKHNPAFGLIDTQPAIPSAQLIGQTTSAPYPLPWSDAGSVRDTYFDGAPLRIIEEEHYDSEV